MPGLSFHHFGLAVKTPGAESTFLSALGYDIGKVVLDPLQNVHLLLATHATQPAVEVIYPAGDGGPLDKLIERHGEGLIYHICYETKSLDQTLRRFKEVGVKAMCISRPKPAVLFGGRPVSFYQVGGLGLIEILE